MARVPADLHVHVDNDVTKERVIKILKSAEENGLKAICMLEHNNINLYKRGGVLEELLIEGIEKYYTGKIVSGIELNCTVKSAPVSKKTGIDYNGYDLHVMYYGFNPQELKAKVDWFDPDVDAERYYKDVDSLCAGLRKLGLPEPPKSIFSFSEGVKPFKQLYKYIESCKPEEKAKYTKVLGEYPHPSAFVRNLAYDPTSIIYFDRAQSPSIVDVINVGKECTKFRCISYPFHINRKLIKDVADYIETMQAIPSKGKDKNFNAVEGPYMLNTNEETNFILNYAKENGLSVTAGSDYQPQDKMYYLPPDAVEKIWYAPAPGLYVRQLFDGGMGLLTIDEEFLAALPDIRDYKIYRQAPKVEVAPKQEVKVEVEETPLPEVTNDIVNDIVDTETQETISEQAYEPVDTNVTETTNTYEQLAKEPVNTTNEENEEPVETGAVIPEPQPLSIPDIETFDEEDSSVNAEPAYIDDIEEDSQDEYQDEQVEDAPNEEYYDEEETDYQYDNNESDGGKLASIDLADVGEEDDTYEEYADDEGQQEYYEDEEYEDEQDYDDTQEVYEDDAEQYDDTEYEDGEYESEDTYADEYEDEVAEEEPYVEEYVEPAPVKQPKPAPKKQPQKTDVSSDLDDMLAELERLTNDTDNI